MGAPFTDPPLGESRINSKVQSTIVDAVELAVVPHNSHLWNVLDVKVYPTSMGRLYIYLHLPIEIKQTQCKYAIDGSYKYCKGYTPVNIPEWKINLILIKFFRKRWTFSMASYVSLPECDFLREKTATHLNHTHPGADWRVFLLGVHP